MTWSNVSPLITTIRPLNIIPDLIIIEDGERPIIIGNTIIGEDIGDLIITLVRRE